jgi:3-phosphoshikimate 1-carboxyvinyltransferase
MGLRARRRCATTCTRRTPTRRSTRAPARRAGRGASGPLVIHGIRLATRPSRTGAIDVGNAGTLMRLLPGWLAAQPGRSYVLDGDASIRRRPVDRIAEPLRAMGAAIDARDGRFPPFTGPRRGAARHPLRPARRLRAGQVVRAARRPVRRRRRRPSWSPRRAGTTRSGCSWPAAPTCARRGRRLRAARGRPRVRRAPRPADLSSAAFLIAAGVLVAGSRVRLRGVNVNWTRTGFLRILARMGGRVEGELEADGAPLTPGEPVSDLEVSAGALAATRVEARRSRWPSTSCRSWRCSGASPRARRRSRAPPS